LRINWIKKWIFCKSVVEEILIEGYSNKLNSNEVNYSLSFQGNPRMAIKFAESTRE
jgi:hypothetical protein